MAKQSPDWPAILAEAPIKMLLRVARRRNAALRAQAGRFASAKKLSICPYGCGQNIGVREAQRHRKDGCPKPEKKPRAA